MTVKIGKTESITPNGPTGTIHNNITKIITILHIFIYSAVNGLLILIWLSTLALTQATFFWPFYPIVGWGIALGLHLLSSLMYYDLVPTLKRVKQKGALGISFLFHFFIYTMVNLIILIPDIVILGGRYFYWPLSMWGIAMGFHALIFFTWDNLLEIEQVRMRNKYDNYGEEKIKLLAKSRLSNLWFLLAHIVYFTIVTTVLYIWVVPILNFEITQRLNSGIILWGILLGIHIIAYYLFSYNDTIQSVTKGLIIHIVLYAVVNIYEIYAWQNQSITELAFPVYSIVPWGIVLSFHIIITLLWERLINSAIAKINRQYRVLDRIDLRSKARKLIFWQCSFITHVAVYITGIILIAITFSIFSIDMRLLVHPAMGWIIGLAIHFSISFVFVKNIKSFWKGTLTIHLITFLFVNTYLVILNIMLGGFLWSAIAIFGWGIGLGIHAILTYVR